LAQGYGTDTEADPREVNDFSGIHRSFC